MTAACSHLPSRENQSILHCFSNTDSISFNSLVSLEVHKAGILATGGTVKIVIVSTLETDSPGSKSLDFSSSKLVVLSTIVFHRPANNSEEAIAAIDSLIGAASQ